MKERGRLVRVFRLDEFARTRRPRSVPELHELALDSAKHSESVLDAPSHTPKLAEDELDAKAILPELRSVKKQFPINSLLLAHGWILAACFAYVCRHIVLFQQPNR